MQRTSRSGRNGPPNQNNVEEATHAWLRSWRESKRTPTRQLDQSAWDGWDWLAVAVAGIHIMMAPYTKVEESFNIQAMHDFLYHGWHLHRYDHFEFPGVVPRTFIGALVVSVVSLPAVILVRLAGMPKLYSLLIVRIVLGLSLLATFKLLRTQVTRRWGAEAGRAFVVMTAVQFHLLFYCSRPLPNVYALALANLAHAYWLDDRPITCLRFLVAATVVFRCDVVILLGPIGLSMLLTRQVSFWQAFRACAVAGLLSLGATVAVDSLMWRRVIWPEGLVLFFNTALNKSSEWGVSPFHWYFTSALPRALLGGLPLAAVGLFLERRLLSIALPSLAFVILYSLLPHKELRFIFTALPVFNIAAAVGLGRIYINREKPRWELLYSGAILLLTASVASSIVFSAASYSNYPGGHALRNLHMIARPHVGQSQRSVHIGNLAAISGVSKFCEEGIPWRYFKVEDLGEEDYAAHQFDYLLSEHVKMASYECLAYVRGFTRLRIERSFPPIIVETTPMIYVLGHNVTTFPEWPYWPGCRT